MALENPDALYGIDLGSKYVKITYSPFSTAVGSKILENAYSQKKTDVDGQRTFGNIKQLKKYALSTVFPIRDLLCKKATDVSDFTMFYPMQIESYSLPKCGIFNEVAIVESLFTIDTIYMMYINWMKKQFEIDKKQQPSCVFSIPIYYSSVQCELLESVCNKIGLNEVNFLYDYLASALCFGYENNNSLKGDKYVMLVDMGYLTTYCTVVRYYKGGMEVLSVDYIQYGGKNIDRVILELVNESVVKEFDVKLNNTPFLYLKSQRVLEAAKEKLSADGADSIKIEIESVKDDDDFESVLSKEDVEKRLETTGIADQLKLLLDRCYKAAEIPESFKNTEIVIIGGSLRIPYFQSILLDYLHNISEEKNLTKTLNMDESIAYGCLYFNKIQNGLWQYQCNLPSTKENRYTFINSIEENLCKRDKDIQKLQELRNEIEAAIYSNDHYLEGHADLQELQDQSTEQLEDLKHNPNINDINFLNELFGKVKELNKIVLSKINFNTPTTTDDKLEEEEEEEKEAKKTIQRIRINKKVLDLNVKEMEGSIFGSEKQCPTYISLDSEPEKKKKRGRNEVSKDNDDNEEKKGKKNKTNSKKKQIVEDENKS